MQRFIFLSSTGVFGPDAAPRIDEDEDPRPVHLYGITKRAGEDIVRRLGGSDRHFDGKCAAGLDLRALRAADAKPGPA